MHDDYERGDIVQQRNDNDVYEHGDIVLDRRDAPKAHVDYGVLPADGYGRVLPSNDGYGPVLN